MRTYPPITEDQIREYFEVMDIESLPTPANFESHLEDRHQETVLTLTEAGLPTDPSFWVRSNENGYFNWMSIYTIVEYYEIAPNFPRQGVYTHRLGTAGEYLMSWSTNTLK